MSKIKFCILDQMWSIEKVPSHDSNLYINNNVCCGSAWPAKLAIYISDELSPERAWRTILHELCHAYIAATQAAVPENWSEEDLCEFMSIYALELTGTATKLHRDLYRGADNE